MAAAAALADVHQCFELIGFGDVQHRNAIIDEGGFGRLTDFYDINETDIRDMAESFSKRSPAANRIIFGMRRIKWLISMMYWPQDHQRCSEDPDLDDIAGIELCTDPHDPYRELGIWDRARGLHVPLQRRGNFIGLRSYKPDPDEVLRAMANGDRNIIYLDPHDDYEPTIHNTDEPKEIAPISGFDVNDTSACCQCDQCGQVNTDYLILSDISTSLDTTTFAKSLISNINIADVGSTMITQ